MVGPDISCRYHQLPPVYGLHRATAGPYFAGMAEPPDQSMRLLTAFASAAATAYALAYLAHSEWGVSRIDIREDALALAALLGVALTVKTWLRRKNNRGS